VSEPTFTRERTSRRRDGGVSLVELLVVMALIGLVATVLTSAIIVILRTAPSTELRTDDARSTRGLATWLSHDVASTPPDGFDTDASRSSGCGTSPGVNLLRLEWTETQAAKTTRYIANYRHVPVGNAYRIQRITCSGTGTPPFSNGSVQSVTSGLGSSRPEVKLSPGTTGVTVVFPLTGPSGDEILLEVSSRNPSEFFS
jgi:prepilin-type N-terminal cleavage/methylation domain-containing protein